jgi:hypothetical protein
MMSLWSLPGGHLGRFIVWTKSAFEQLDAIFGTHEKRSIVKKNYVLPRPIMGNPDLARIINSDEIQSVVQPKKVEIKRWALKKNPLKNLGALLKLNPYAKTARRMELLAQEQRAKAKAEKLDIKRKTAKVKNFNLYPSSFQRWLLPGQALLLFLLLFTKCVRIFMVTSGMSVLSICKSGVGKSRTWIVATDSNGCWYLKKLTVGFLKRLCL